MENIHLNTIQRFFLMLKAYKKEVSLTYLYAIFGGLLNLVLPLGIQTSLNLLQAGTISSSWYLIVLIVTLGTVLNGAILIMQASVNETLQKKIFTDMSFDFATRIPKIDLENTRDMHLPEMVNRFFETLTLTKSVPKILSDLTAAVLQIFFGLILLSFYHPYFIVLDVVLTLILFSILRLTSPSGLKTNIKESKFKYEVVYWLEELGRTVATFKHGAHSDYGVKKTDKLVSNYLDAKTQHFEILKIQSWSFVFFKTLITFILLVLGGFLVLRNQINIGQFVASEIVIILVINASEKLILLMETIYDVLTSLDKIGHVMDIPLEATSTEKVLQKSGMAVTLNNLGYTFAHTDKPTLSHIDLVINPLERVCIAGYNASGRTTLIHIIASFLKPQQGGILFDGIPMDNYDLASLRSKIGYFSSTEQIFSGTLRENITLGDDSIDTETVVSYLSGVGLTNFLGEIQGGLNAILLPDGKNLSRSIVSKILIARSLASRPKILLIENLLNNLQANDKEKVIEIITSENRTWTLVCASDDLEIASRCDKIIILDKGNIVAQGSFEEIKKSIHFNQVFKTIKTHLKAQT